MLASYASFFLELCREFGKGMTRPSCAVIAAVLALPLAQVLLFGPALISRIEPGYVIQDSYDSTTYTNLIALRLAAASADGIIVAHVGTSSSREATDGISRIQDRLSEAAGKRISYWPLFLDNQSIWEAGALADQIPEGSRGVLLIEMNLARFVFGPKLVEEELETPKLGVPSEFASDELRRSGIPAPRLTGMYLVDFRAFIAPRLDRIRERLSIRPIDYHWHRYDDPHLTEGRRNRGESLLMPRVKEMFDQTSDWNLAMLERLIARVRGRTRMTVVIHEATVDPEAEKRHPDTFPRYRAMIAAFCARLGVPYLDIPREAGLTTDEYMSWNHLGKPEGREKFENALVRMIAPMLKQIPEGS